MTQPLPQQNPSSPSDGPAPSAVVHPPDNSRLDQLAAEYALLQPKAQETAERLKEIRTAITAELQRARPGVAEVWLTSPHLDRPLVLTYYPPGWTVDSKALREKAPDTWRSWRKERAAYWQLKAVS